jgi:hypothetical protein
MGLVHGTFEANFKIWAKKSETLVFYSEKYTKIVREIS